MKNHILVIEDDTATNRVLFYILRKEGFEVTEAFTGVDGVTLARQKHPGLITV